jgi:hypothetical protein
MSTKIYYAWRIPRSKLNEFTDIIREATWAWLLERIDGWMAAVSDEAVQQRLDEEHEARLKLYEDKDVPWYVQKGEVSPATRWRFLEQEIIEACTDARKRYHDSDASFNFWVRGRHVYIIPYGKAVLPDDKPDWIQDYSYWDNSDHPDGITYRQWEARGVMWHKVCLDNWDKNRYHHIISKFDNEFSKSGMIVEIHLLDSKG